MENRPQGPKLISRKEQYAALREAFESAATGQTRVVFVSGEPGIGKTHLMSVFADEAGRQGAAVLRGGASESEGMPPYLPFLEALGRHIRTSTSDELKAQIGVLAPILITIFPELRLKLDDLASSYSLPPDQARLRLYEAVGAFLERIAHDQPLILILDDLQWADSASLDLLTAIARYQPESRLLVLGACRSGQVEENPALSRAIRELNRLRVLHTIDLEPISHEETAWLASEYLGAPLDPTGNDLLFAQSEGNPFFAEELLLGWLDGNALHEKIARDGEPYYQLDRTVAATTPASIVSAVRERLVRLSPQVLETLRAAAIIGRAFDAALVSTVVGEAREAIEERLLLASHANLIQPTSDQTFVFKHDKIRECLYQEVVPFRRQRLHGFIGRALEMQAEQPDARLLADLAYHYSRSGDRARGAEYARRAAEQALEAYAAEEAMAHFKTALELIEPNDDRRGALLLRFGESASLAGDESQAVSAFTDAHEWFRRAGDHIQAGRATLFLGRSWWRQEAIPQARSAFETAHGLLKDHQGPELVEVLVDLGSLLAVSQHELDAGISLARQALRLAELLEDERALASSNRTLGNLLVRINDLPTGVPLLEKALELAIAADDLAEAAECCAALANAYFWQGSIEQSRIVTLKRLEFAKQSHDPYQMRHIYPWLAILPGLQGRLSEAHSYLELAEIEIRPLASPEPQAYLLFCRAGLAYFSGEYAKANEYVNAVIEILRQFSPHALIWYQGFIANIDIALGNLDDARASLQEFEPLLESMPEGSMPTSEPLVYVTEAALALGDRERLDRYYPKLKVFAGQFHDLSVDRQLGQIETLQGNYEQAETRLRTAEELVRREHIVWEIARVLEAQADLALARGGHDSMSTACDRLSQACATIDPTISPSEHRRLQARIDAIEGRRSRSQARPAGLSPREVEVLSLVATGMSNREIADKLFISEKTVINHLTHIFNKIGVDNRAAAAAFAVRNDLA